MCKDNTSSSSKSNRATDALLSQLLIDCGINVHNDWQGDIFPFHTSDNIEYDYEYRPIYDPYDFSIEDVPYIASVDDDGGATDTAEDETSCCICLERIVDEDMYSTNECEHVTCSECMRSYLNGALHDSRYKDYEQIYCPGLNCIAQFVTGEILPRIFTEKDKEESWWSRALIRVFVQNATVCPFDDCNEVFDIDESEAEECAFAECQSCHRGFCLSCRKEWHTADTQAISENVRKATEMLENVMLTAEKENWSRCPTCKHMVEKNNGCNHITCRCGTQFCYRCGSLYSFNRCVNRCEMYAPHTLKAVRKPMFYVARFDRNRNSQQ